MFGNGMSDYLKKLHADNKVLREALTSIRDSLAGQKSPVAAAILAWANTALAETEE